MILRFSFKITVFSLSCLFFIACKKNDSEVKRIKNFYAEIFKNHGCKLVIEDSICVFKKDDYLNDVPGFPYFVANQFNREKSNKIILANENFPINSFSELFFSQIGLLDNNGILINDSCLNYHLGIIECSDSYAYCGPKMRFSGPFFFDPDSAIINLIGINNITGQNESLTVLIYEVEGQWGFIDPINGISNVQEFISRYRLDNRSSFVYPDSIGLP